MAMFAKCLAFFSISICVASAIQLGKQPCCFSKTWHARMTTITGTVRNGTTIPEFTENTLVIDYDGDLKRVKSTGTFTAGYGPNKTTTVFKAWNDYKAGKMYAFNNQALNCTVSARPQLQKGQITNCVPDSLQWKASYVLGSGSEAVHVDSWEGRHEDFRYIFVTTVNDCTPVSITRFGEDSDDSRIFETTRFSNFIQGNLSAPGVVDIPQECLMN